MIKIIEFDDILVVSEEQNQCFLKICRGEYDQYFVYCNIKIYGVPVDLPSETEHKIFDGDYKEAEHIAVLTGTLILCKHMLRMGFSLYNVCDDMSSELEHIMSALQEKNAPLSETTGDEFQDVFYINELTMTEQYNDEDLMISLLNDVPNIVFYLYHVYPDILAYYPTPLPYEEDAHKKLKKDMAAIVARDILDREKDGSEESSDYQLALDEEQFNYLLGRRNLSDAYPETAKDKKLWGIYQNAGFKEVGKSRLIFRFSDE